MLKYDERGKTDKKMRKLRRGKMMKTWKVTMYLSIYLKNITRWKEDNKMKNRTKREWKYDEKMTKGWKDDTWLNIDHNDCSANIDITLYAAL